MELKKLFTFTVDRASPHVVADSSGLWISYFDFPTKEEGKDSISLFDFKGNKLRNINLDNAEIRRMTSDLNGKLYMCCLESQSVKCFDISKEQVTPVVDFEGYPAGIEYCKKDESLIICDNQCPSYFVYEGHHFSRLTKVSLSSFERQIVSNDKCHAYISNVSIGKDGTLWTADYINDTIHCLSTDGKLDKSFPGKDDSEMCLMPLDICCDNNGLAFVICTASKCLYVLNSDCGVVHKFDFDFIPSSVEVFQNLIWIGNMDKNNVHVFSYNFVNKPE